MLDREVDEICRCALALLARREPTGKELRRKLEGRGVERALIVQVLDELRSEGLQSDGRFAENYVRARAEKGCGPLRIAQEIKARGIEASMVEEQVRVNAPEEDSRIVALRSKRFGKRPATDTAERLHQYRFLQYRGFTAAQIRRLMPVDE